MINTEAYEKYLLFSDQKLKLQTDNALNIFINSFETIEEKILWTKENISKIQVNNSSRIRFELFNAIILPVLLIGYQRKEAFSLFWLARLVNNYYDNKEVLTEIHNKSPFELLDEAYKIDRTNESIRKEIINEWIKFVTYSQHEWPSGILIGNNGGTIKEYVELKILK